MTKYKTTEDRFEHPEGTIVYPCTKYDYGAANDDTDATGIYHISVSLNEDGSYPFFTIPQDDLVLIS